MAYTKTTWTDNVTDIDENNLNKIEQGIYNNSVEIKRSPRRLDGKWVKICNVEFTNHAAGVFHYLKIFIGNGYNGLISQNAYIDLICQTATTSNNPGYFGCNAELHPFLSGFTLKNTQIKVIANSNTNYDVWFYTNKTNFCFLNYIAYKSDLVTVTEKFELSDTEPTGTQCNLDYSMVDDEMYYKSGETISVKTGKICFGDITGGATHLRFELTLDKKLTNISSITFTNLQIIVRGVSGYVIGSAGVQIIENEEYNITSTAITSDNTIFIDIAKSTAVSTTNNTPIVVYINSCTLTLN